MKKNTLTVILAIVVILIIVSITENETNSDKLVIGAILPMTGPNAVYGEQLKFGMDYALKTLDPHNTIELKIEDSESKPQTGIAAFNKLINENTDVFVSAFSRVSIPLKDLAKQNNKPLVMTIVSAMSAVDKDHPDVFRIFHNAENMAGVLVQTLEKKGFKKVGIVHLNDEFGASLNETMVRMLKEKGITVVSEAFAPDQTDYRTQIQKMKAAQTDVIVFVTIPPATLLTFVKQSKELGVAVPLMDAAGVLPGVGAVKLLGNAAENIYTFIGTFDAGLTGAELIAELDKQGLDKTYAAAYGYDVVKLIIVAQKISVEKKISVNEALQSITDFEGMEGQYVVTPSEFQPHLIPAQVVGGKLVEVK